MTLGNLYSRYRLGQRVRPNVTGAAAPPPGAPPAAPPPAAPPPAASVTAPVEPPPAAPSISTPTTQETPVQPSVPAIPRAPDPTIPNGPMGGPQGGTDADAGPGGQPDAQYRPTPQGTGNPHPSLPPGAVPREGAPFEPTAGDTPQVNVADTTRENPGDLDREVFDPNNPPAKYNPTWGTAKYSVGFQDAVRQGDKARALRWLTLLGESPDENPQTLFQLQQTYERMAEPAPLAQWDPAKPPAQYDPNWSTAKYYSGYQAAYSAGNKALAGRWLSLLAQSPDEDPRQLAMFQKQYGDMVDPSLQQTSPLPVTNPADTAALANTQQNYQNTLYGGGSTPPPVTPPAAPPPAVDPEAAQQKYQQDMQIWVRRFQMGLPYTPPPVPPS